MSHGGGNYQGNRGHEGNYAPNQGGQQHPSSSNNMQYNYTMNQPYAGNMPEMAYPDQYYGQQGGYGYDAEAYEEADYDNLDEIDRELNMGGSADYEAEMIKEMESMHSPSYGQQQRHFQSHEPSPRSGPYVPASAVPVQNGKLSSHAHEFWFPECRNCPCCKGFKHGCGCCKNGVDTCKDASCVDGAFESQVSAELASRPNNAPTAATPAQPAATSPVGKPSASAAPGAEICKYEKSPGGCRFGAGCRFVHSAPAAASAGAANYGAFPPAAPASGAVKCTYFARGNCQFGEKCRFSHL